MIMDDNLSNFVPHDKHGKIRFVRCCNNKKLYVCKFPGEPLTSVCKSHIKDELAMQGIERIFNLKLKKEIPIEDMGFEKASPTVQETVEKIKQENSNIQETESLCIKGIAFGNRLIKSYQRFMDESKTTYGEDSTSYVLWKTSKKVEEGHVSDLCKILLSCQIKPKPKKIKNKRVKVSHQSNNYFIDLNIQR